MGECFRAHCGVLDIAVDILHILSTRVSGMHPYAVNRCKQQTSTCFLNGSSITAADMPQCTVAPSDQCVSTFLCNCIALTVNQTFSDGGNAILRTTTTHALQCLPRDFAVSAGVMAAVVLLTAICLACSWLRGRRVVSTTTTILPSSTLSSASVV